MARSTITFYSTVQEAKDSMLEGEIAYANESGVETLIIKKDSSTFQTFADISAPLAANGFDTITELVEEVARFRDHGLTDEEP